MGDKRYYCFCWVMGQIMLSEEESFQGATSACKFIEKSTGKCYTPVIENNTFLGEFHRSDWGKDYERNIARNVQAIVKEAGYGQHKVKKIEGLPVLSNK